VRRPWVAVCTEPDYGRDRILAPRGGRRAAASATANPEAISREPLIRRSLGRPLSSAIGGGAQERPVERRIEAAPRVLGLHISRSLIEGLNLWLLVAIRRCRATDTSGGARQSLLQPGVISGKALVSDAAHAVGRRCEHRAEIAHAS